MAITINGTNTTANPGITGADTDTGLSFGTNEVSINTDGTERFRVGSAGQFGIGGATYGSSGQVLTSAGASAAPTWTTPSSGGITWLDTVDTSSTGNFTITGIDTDARMIVVSFYQVSQSTGSSNQIFMRVGNGSVNSGNNYYWSVSRAVDADTGNTAQSFYRLIVDSFTSHTFKFSGTITLLRTQDSSNPLWSISHLLSENGGGNEPIYGAGSFTDTLIDRIQFVGAGSFDSGAVRVGYIL